MRHIDLFSGIGGFAFAADCIFGEIEHTFCEIDPFCRGVLKKHWPKSKVYGNIKEFSSDTDTDSERRERKSREAKGQCGLRGREGENEKPFILTGGFPCQPFSHAGRRRGTGDDRYLWPEMFRVIQSTKPKWVVAENVRGLATWDDGVVLETVCFDLEIEGYEVQPLIIPACAVGAPHRRDRIWIIAHRNDTGGGALEGGVSSKNRSKDSEERKHTLDRPRRQSSSAANSGQQLRKQGSGEGMEAGASEWPTGTISDKRIGEQDWKRDWREVALATCNDRMDDGLPRQVGGVSYSFAKWRKEALKAMGNAIVPAVAVQIFEAIKLAEQSELAVQ